MSTGCNFEVQQEEHTLVVLVKNNITSVADQPLKQELATLQARLGEREIQAVVFDFAEISFFGSTMLETLLQVWKTAQAHGRRMSLCNVSRVGREVLHVSKFDTIWKIFPNRQAALAA